LDRLAYLEALTEAQKVEIEAQKVEINTQRIEIEALHITNKKYEPKIADPEPFNGNRLQLPNFLAKCRLKFSGQPSQFTSEKAKVYYAGSRLAEPAFSWFQPLLATAEDPESDTPPELTSFQTFAQSLMNTYGDPNLEATSEREIKTLVQTTLVSQYKAEFQRLHQYIKWNESALLDRFYSGLKDKLKDEITQIGRPTALKDLQDLATRLDARFYE